MSYTIAGKKILNEHMALGVFGLYGLGAYFAMGGKKDGAGPAASPAAKAKATPPLNASSSDEEAFIKQFLAEAEGGKGNERLV